MKASYKSGLWILLLMVTGFSPKAPAQNFEWARQMGGTGNDEGRSIAVDDSGNVYTTGFFRGTVDFDPNSGVWSLTSAGSQDIFISKIDASGNFVWAMQLGGATSDEGRSIAVDDSGNVYVTGSFTGPVDFDPGPGTLYFAAANSDMFIIKLDPWSYFIWAKQIGGPNGEGGNSITVDGNGNVYTTGAFSGTVDFDPGAGIYNLTTPGSQCIFILKLDASGNFTWARQIGETNGNTGHSVAVDDSGNVYTTGFFIGASDFDPSPTGTYTLTSAGNSDIFVSMLNASGNFVWAAKLGGSGHDYGYSIAVDGNSNVYTTGWFNGTSDFDPSPTGTYPLTSTGGSDIFINKLDVSGNFVWARQLGGISSEYGRSILVDNSSATEGIYTTGHFRDTVDFDPSPTGTFPLTSAGDADVFVSKLDLSGNFVWATSLGGTFNDWGYSSGVDDSGNVYTTGYFNGTFDFDPGAGTFTLTSAGYNDIFIHKMSPLSTGITEHDINVTAVYPNPVNQILNIDLTTEAAVAVYSLTGVLMDQLTTKQNHRIDVSDYPAGMYFIYLSGDGNPIAVKKIVIMH